MILTWWRFRGNGLDSGRVNPELGELFVSSLSVRFGCLGVTASIVGLPVGLVLIKLPSAAVWQVDRCHEDVGRTPDLFHRQQFAAEDVIRGRELLANSGTEQLTQDRHVKMSMNASPTATFEVIQAKLLFGFSKTVFHGPAPEGDPQDFSQRPTVASRYTV